MTSPKPTIETQKPTEKPAVKPASNAPEKMKSKLNTLMTSAKFKALDKEVGTKDIIEEQEKKYTDQISNLDTSKNPETALEKDAFHTLEVTTTILIQNMCGKVPRSTEGEILKTPKSFFDQCSKTQLSSIETTILNKLKDIFKNTSSPLHDALFSEWEDSVKIIRDDFEKNLADGVEHLMNDWQKKSTFEKMTTLGTGFVDTYKTPLLVGGGIIGAIWLGRRLFKKDGGVSGKLFSFKNFLIGGGVAALGFLGLSSIGKIGDMFSGLFGSLDKVNEAAAKAAAAAEKAKEELEKMRQKATEAKEAIEKAKSAGEAVQEAYEDVEKITLREATEKIQDEGELFLQPVKNFINDNKTLVAVAGAIGFLKSPLLRNSLLNTATFTAKSALAIAQLSAHVAVKHPLVTTFGITAAVMHYSQLEDIKIPKDPTKAKEMIVKILKDRRTKDFIGENEAQNINENLEKATDEQLDEIINLIKGDKKISDYEKDVTDMVSKIGTKAIDVAGLSPKENLENETKNGVAQLREVIKERELREEDDVKKKQIASAVEQIDSLVRNFSQDHPRLTNKDLDLLENIGNEMNIQFHLNEKTHVIEALFYNKEGKAKKMEIGYDPNMNEEALLTYVRSHPLRIEELKGGFAPLWAVSGSIQEGLEEVKRGIYEFTKKYTNISEALASNNYSIVMSEAGATLVDTTKAGYTYFIGSFIVFGRLIGNSPEMLKGNYDYNEIITDYGQGMVISGVIGSAKSVSSLLQGKPRGSILAHTVLWPFYGMKDTVGMLNKSLNMMSLSNRYGIKSYVEARLKNFPLGLHKIPECLKSFTVFGGTNKDIHALAHSRMEELQMVRNTMLDAVSEGGAKKREAHLESVQTQLSKIHLNTSLGSTNAFEVIKAKYNNLDFQELAKTGTEQKDRFNNIVKDIEEMYKSQSLIANDEIALHDAKTRNDKNEIEKIQKRIDERINKWSDNKLLINSQLLSSHQSVSTHTSAADLSSTHQSSHPTIPHTPISTIHGGGRGVGKLINVGKTLLYGAPLGYGLYQTEQAISNSFTKKSDSKESKDVDITSEENEESSSDITPEEKTMLKEQRDKLSLDDHIMLLTAKEIYRIGMECKQLSKEFESKIFKNIQSLSENEVQATALPLIEKFGEETLQSAIGIAEGRSEILNKFFSKGGKLDGASLNKYFALLKDQGVIDSDVNNSDHPLKYFNKYFNISTKNNQIDLTYTTKDDLRNEIFGLYDMRDLYKPEMLNKFKGAVGFVADSFGSMAPIAGTFIEGARTLKMGQRGYSTPKMIQQYGFTAMNVFSDIIPALSVALKGASMAPRLAKAEQTITKILDFYKKTSSLQVAQKATLGLEYGTQVFSLFQAIFEPEKHGHISINSLK